MTPALFYLVSALENPPPPGAEVAALRAGDGTLVRCACWRSHDTASGTLVILPGRSEFIEKYFEVTADLMRRRFAVIALDWRGQGGSQRELDDPRKGHIDDFSIYRRDLQALVAHMTALDLPKPWYALAHSMGGAILLDALADGETAFARAMLSAPMIGLYGLPSRTLAQILVRALNLVGLGGSYLPGSGKHAPSLFDPFPGNPLTSDETRYQRCAATLIAGPDLALGAPTTAWTAAAFRLMRGFANPEFGLTIACPLLFANAGADTIVSAHAAEALASRIRGAASITIPGARHEILFERDACRDQFWAAFDAFIPAAA
jgi:lysophospholipase